MSHKSYPTRKLAPLFLVAGEANCHVRTEFVEGTLCLCLTQNPLVVIHFVFQYGRRATTLVMQYRWHQRNFRWRLLPQYISALHESTHEKCDLFNNLGEFLSISLYRRGVTGSTSRGRSCSPYRSGSCRSASPSWDSSSPYHSAWCSCGNALQ